MQQLFFNKEVTGYFLVCSIEDLSVLCDECNKNIEIGEFVFINRAFSDKNKQVKRMCHNCIKPLKQQIYNDFIVAEVTTNIPARSHIVLDFPPSLSASGCSVYDAALSNKEIRSDTSNTEVIDRTRYCKPSEQAALLTDEIAKNKRLLKMRTKELSQPINDEVFDNIVRGEK